MLCMLLDVVERAIKVFENFLPFLTTPMTEKHRKISHSFTEAARAVALKSINDAAGDIRCNDGNVIDIGVSLEGLARRMEQLQQ